MTDEPPGTEQQWHCEAYGPEGVAVGAVCFFSGELGQRVCASLAECHQAMASERQRVFRVIQERAAEGDQVMAGLAETFTDPEQLLGGGETGTESGERGDG